MFTQPFSSIRNSFKRASKRARASLQDLPTFGGLRTITSVAASLLLVALVYLAQSSNAALIARNLRVKEDRIQQLEQQNAQLRYEISAVTSPAAVEQRAKKLGLGPAKRVIYASLPELQGEDTLKEVAMLPQAPEATAQAESTAGQSVVQQILSMFGLGDSNSAQAQSQ